jgi:hypothetical protein
MIGFKFFLTSESKNSQISVNLDPNMGNIEATNLQFMLGEENRILKFCDVMR